MDIRIISNQRLDELLNTYPKFGPSEFYRFYLEVLKGL